MMYFHGLLGIYVVVTDYIHHKTLRGVMVVWGFIWAIIGCAGMMLWLL
jgi:succinate dehydrogenase hydrophobic anchor subunit